MAWLAPDAPLDAQRALAFRTALRACPEAGQWKDEDAYAWWQAEGQALLASRQREGQRMRTPVESTVAVDLNAR